MIQVGRLYRLSRINYQGNTGIVGGLMLKGVTVNVQVRGSQKRPATLAAMVDITETGSITVAGAYSFSLFPEYICITGTITSIEIVNYNIEDLGVIS